MSEVTFEQAIAQAETLLNDQSMPTSELESSLISLLQTSNGARGFWVTYLTRDYPLNLAIINALKVAPEPSAELMIKNVAMSSAMAITHQRSGNLEQAASSAKVTHRSLELLQMWQSDIATAIAQAMYHSAIGKDSKYTDFFAKWGYDSEQKTKIAEQLAKLLSQSAI